MNNLNSIKYRILFTDVVIIVLATLLAFSLRFSVSADSGDLVGPIQIGGTVLPILWVIVLIL